MKTTILTITETDTEATDTTARELLRVEIPAVASPSKAFVAIIQAIDGLDKPKRPRSDKGKPRKKTEAVA